MTERIEDEDIRNAPIRWKVPGAGFVGAGGFVALIDGTRTRSPAPSTTVRRRTGRPTRERATRPGRRCGALEGDILEEARKSLAESRFLGAAYHLSDCQLLDDRPLEETP